MNDEEGEKYRGYQIRPRLVGNVIGVYRGKYLVCSFGTVEDAKAWIDNRKKQK